MTRAAPPLLEVEHARICYDRGRYCGHPRQSGIFHYGGGELALLHSHAPSAYQQPEDVSHSFTTGYASRARILLQRSMDGGHTWPAAHEVTVWDESRPLEEKRARLARGDEAAVERPEIDLSHPDAAVYFARPATGPEDAEGRPTLECCAFRSADRGRTWEETPTRVRPPTGWTAVHRDAHPLVQCPDRTQLGAMTLGRRPSATAPAAGAVAIYGTDDGGLTWEYLALAVEDDTGHGRPTYAGLLLLPSGRLQCYTPNIGGRRNALQVSESLDGGYGWGAPRPIVAWGQSPWAARRLPGQHRPGPGLPGGGGAGGRGASSPPTASPTATATAAAARGRSPAPTSGSAEGRRTRPGPAPQPGWTMPVSPGGGRSASSRRLREWTTRTFLSTVQSITVQLSYPSACRRQADRAGAFPGGDAIARRLP
ncbi:MAG: sialidase family protein [Gemmatimonadota bacterium]